MTVGDAISVVESQTRYVFTYSSSAFDTGSVVEFDSAELSIDQFMGKIIGGRNFAYIIRDHHVAITPVATPDKSRPSVAIVINPDELLPPPTVVLESDMPAPEIESEVIVEMPPIVAPHEYTPVGREFGFPRRHPSVGLKTNLLYLATTTPNLALEFAVSRKVTLDLMFGYNGFEFPKKGESNPKLKHWLAAVEGRYWFCRSFEGTYIGLHGFHGRFNVENIPLLNWPSYRAKGYVVGGGLALGHHWALGRYWGLEAQLGLGVAYFDFDKYACGACGTLNSHRNKFIFTPTKCSLSLVYFIR